MAHVNQSAMAFEISIVLFGWEGNSVTIAAFRAKKMRSHTSHSLVLDPNPLLLQTVKEHQWQCRPVTNKGNAAGSFPTENAVHVLMIVLQYRDPLETIQS